MREENGSPRKILGIEARVSWANVVEIITIVAAASVFYVQSQDTMADVEKLKPEVQQLRIQNVQADGALAAVTARQTRLESEHRELRSETREQLTDINRKLDDIRDRLPPRR